MNIGGKEITIYPAQTDNSPLVILHIFSDEGQQVYDALKKLTTVDFSLVTIGNLDWDKDMSPWAIPPIYKNDTPCSGGADEYLHLLLNDILPQVLQSLSSAPKYVALAGYSLAGLFSLYAVYHTNIFSRIMSASGSFWFPDFKEYAQSHNPQIMPEKVYFSLGDKEAKTRNTILQTVEENTILLQKHFTKLGCHTIFEIKSGNHFQDTTNRTAKGIAWILND